MPRNDTDRYRLIQTFMKRNRRTTGPAKRTGVTFGDTGVSRGDEGQAGSASSEAQRLLMPISKYNRYFGGKRGSAEKAYSSMIEQYGAEKGKRRDQMIRNFQSKHRKQKGHG
jgi:hypothetical protein